LIINALLDKGANRNELDASGNPPQISAQIMREVDGLTYLKERLFLCIRQATDVNDCYTAQALKYLKQGVIPSYREAGTLLTPQHWAAYNGNMILFEKINKGYYATLRDRENHTPREKLFLRSQLGMLRVVLEMPACILVIINSYNIDDFLITFVSDEKKLAMTLLQSLKKAPAKLPELQEFIKKVEMTLPTVPKIADMFNNFLVDNQAILPQIIHSFDGFIKELSQTVNLDLLPALKKYLEVSKTVKCQTLPKQTLLIGPFFAPAIPLANQKKAFQAAPVKPVNPSVLRYRYPFSG